MFNYSTTTKKTVAARLARQDNRQLACHPALAANSSHHMSAVNALVTVLEGGHSTQIERIANNSGQIRWFRFANLFGVIRHPKKGVCLFDTGYASHFISCTQHFPELIYRKVVPVTFSPEESAVEQLRRDHKIEPEDVKYIFISHFHGDHYAGCLDFPKATFVYSEESYENVKHKNRIAATECAFVKGMIPPDFEARSQVVTFGTLNRSIPAGVVPALDGNPLPSLAQDFFGDGTMYVVPLPGHTVGHMGLLIRGPRDTASETTGDWCFFVGDAAWSSDAYRSLSPPSRLTKRVHSGGWPSYIATLELLHDLHRMRPDVRIVPAHCAEIYDLCVVRKNPIWPVRYSLPAPGSPGAKTVLVFGATGFVGGYLCRRLIELGLSVTATGRNKSKGAELAALGIRFVPCEISERATVMALCQGTDVVFHVAAKCAPWGQRAEFVSANIDGTQNIVDGCLAASVRRLVYCSTPSVYFTTAMGNVRNVSEMARLPLPSQLPSDYASTKLVAERVVESAWLAGLPVVSIRPRGIIAYDDPTILSRIVEKVRGGRLPIIGDGENVVDMTHVENVVEALICAMKAPPAVLGKIFNVTNGEPQKVWPMVSEIAGALGVKAPSRRLPYALLYWIASFIEFVFWILLRLNITSKEPPLTRYTVNMLANTCTLDISAARRELGYVPIVPFRVGLTKILNALKSQAAKKSS